MMEVWHGGPKPPNQNYLITDLCKHLFKYNVNSTICIVVNRGVPAPHRVALGELQLGFSSGPGAALKLLSPGICLQGRD